MIVVLEISIVNSLFQSLLQTEYDAGQFVEATCAGHTNKPLCLEEGCCEYQKLYGLYPGIFYEY